MKKFGKIGAIVLGIALMVSVFMMPSAVATKAAGRKEYNAYINVSSNGSGLAIEPTLVFEPQSVEEITACTTKRPRPASVILSPDSKMKVFGSSLTEVFDSAVKGKFIPVLRIDDDNVDAFITWMTDEYFVADMMAICDDIKLIEKLYANENTYLVNTVYDLTEKKIPDDRYGTWPYVAEANKAGCNILMFDAADKNIGVAAEYVSAMTKSCWAYADDELEAVGAIAAGCYGVVTKDADDVANAIKAFGKKGFARAQYLGAHRGITAYCNENSLTAVAAAVNEGATHVEVDLEITPDGQIYVCHDAQTNRMSDGALYFDTAKSDAIDKLTLTDYSRRYGEGFCKLEDMIDVLSGTDMIMIFELKFSGATDVAVNKHKAIESLKEAMARYPQMDGHWITISFYAPYAKGMREYLPEIPVGYLGAGQAGIEAAAGEKAWSGMHSALNNYAGTIKMLRTFGICLDEMYGSTHDTTALSYLARGYTQNTWTFESVTEHCETSTRYTSHFETKTNIATTNGAEQAAMFVKNIPVKGLTLTSEELAAGKKTLDCESYCGWVLEDVECEIVEVAEKDGKKYVMLYYKQLVAENAAANAAGTVTRTVEYGIYSDLVAVEAA